MQDKIKRVFLESSISRIWQHITNGKNFAVISAFLGDDDELDMESHKQLAKDIRQLGLGYIPLDSGYSYKDTERGHDKIKNEKSYFIPNISKEDALQLGEKYGQETILWKDQDEFVMIRPDGGVEMTFKKDESDSLTFDKDVLKMAFSSLLRANKSQKGKKFAFVSLESVKEFHCNSVSSYKNKKVTPLWNDIF